ncbi:MAG: peroxiredoxin [Halobacteria archaeon]|nr:peroxiredoxin [Halobacteria archaeon]
MLSTGESAPAIALPDTDMHIRTLAEFAGSWVVVYFYPKDDTPGCTIQANEFTELCDDFRDTGITVLGISPDDCFSHQAFRQKYGLKINLLADVDKVACNDYGVYREKEKDGVKKMGIVRSTFVVDPGGKLAYVEYGVTPKDHARKLLEFVRSATA